MTRILAVGDELISGAKVDTNSAEIARELASERGIPITGVELCGDGEGSIRTALTRYLDTPETIIITGGLGPTADDRTRQVLAAMAHVSLVEDPLGRRELAAGLAGRGLAWSEALGRQVLVPQGFTPLPNAVGQALGLHGKIGKATIFALPGVPREMRVMLAQEVLPRIPQAGELANRVLTATGAPEAEIGDRLHDLMSCPEPLVGVTAENGTIVVRIQARGTGAEERVAKTANLVQVRLGPLFVGEGTTDLPTVVGRLLVEREITIATAESCTGGMLAAALVSYPGISAVFQGGFSSYANRTKEEWVGVDPRLLVEHGAVSAPVAEALALGAAQKAQARMGVGITGIAGPGGAVAGKPVGTVHIALVLDGRLRQVRSEFRGDRQMVRKSAMFTALRLIREMILQA